MNVSVRHRSLIVGLILIPVAAIGMTGCVTNGDVSDELDAPTGNSQEATPKPSEVEEAPVEAEIVVGGVVDAETANEIRANRDGGFKIYTLADGTNVVTSRTEPTPESVKADIGVKLATAAQADSGNPGMFSTTIAAYKQAKASTGRSAISVVQVATFNSAGENPGMYWITLGTKDVINNRFQSKDQAIAFAQSDIQGQTTPGDWDLLVAP